MTLETDFSRVTPSILIVDDAPVNLDLLAGLLRGCGYEPRPVTSGKLALAAARADPPDLILLDVRMPEMDGFEVCAHLKADATLKEIPVIFITALTDAADKVKAFSLGAVDYISKPFQVEEIEARVRSHLNLRALRRQLSAQNEILEAKVAQRTRELAKAYERLAELGQIKDDFLKMISHEIRTPANGVLGLGELIIDLSPDTEEIRQYSMGFRESSLRLRNLLDDASLIANMEKLTIKNVDAPSFSTLLLNLQTSMPDIQVSMPAFGEVDLKTIFIRGNQSLLQRALETIVRLALTFSLDRHVVNMTGVLDTDRACVRFDVDALSLSEDAVESFFKIESMSRAISPAESMGLSPIVAHKIILVFGGDLKMVKIGGKTGYLEVILLTEPNNVQPG